MSSSELHCPIEPKAIKIVEKIIRRVICTDEIAGVKVCGSKEGIAKLAHICLKI